MTISRVLSSPDAVECILEINELHTVTKEVVETARENLVIGKPEREKGSRLTIVRSLLKNQNAEL